jgi:hypothetical protein
MDADIRGGSELLACCARLLYPPAVVDAHRKLARLAASKLPFTADAFSNTLPQILRFKGH